MNNLIVSICVSIGYLPQENIHISLICPKFTQFKDLTRKAISKSLLQQNCLSKLPFDRAKTDATGQILIVIDFLFNTYLIQFFVYHCFDFTS